MYYNVGDWPDTENAELLINVISKILRLLRENKFPFIAKIMKDKSVFIWRTQPMRIRRNRR